MLGSTAARCRIRRSLWLAAARTCASIAAVLLAVLYLSGPASADPISPQALGADVFTATSGGQLVPSNLSLASSSGLGVIRKQLIDETNADPVFTLAASAGLRVAPMLGLDEQLSPSDAASAMAQYVTTFAERYGPNGTFWSQNPTLPYLPVQSFEIGNEPNMPLQWVQDSTHLHWTDPASYAQVYEAARSALHQVDPSGIAVVGGLADSAGLGVDLQHDEQWLSALTPGTVDAVGYHPYTFDVSDSLMSVDTLQLRQWMNANGLGSVPLQINEFGACEITSATTTNIGACPATGQQDSATWGAAVASFTKWALCTPGLNVQAVMPFYWGGTPSSDGDAWLTMTTTAGTLTSYGQQYLAEAQALTTVGCPPMNTSPPTISGVALAGAMLVGSQGQWSSSASPSFSYQWQRCAADGSNCTNIPGATSSSYQVQGADVGSALEFSVTATNQGGSTTVASSPVIVPSPVASPSASAPASAAAPAIIVKVTSPRRHSRLVTLTVRFARAADVVRVVASRGRHRVLLHRVRHRRGHRLASASRLSSAISFTVRLRPGRWTITVFVRRAGGGAPIAVRRTITVRA